MVQQWTVDIAGVSRAIQEPTIVPISASPRRGLAARLRACFADAAAAVSENLRCPSRAEFESQIEFARLGRPFQDAEAVLPRTRLDRLRMGLVRRQLVLLLTAVSSA